MAINTSPIFSKRGDIQWAATPINAANTARDGTGTVASIFTAGADGAFVQRLIARSLGTNVASVLRVFINNGSSNAVAANNCLINEMALPATTLSEVTALPPYEMALNFALPAGHSLICTIGTAVAAGYRVSVLGGSYTE
jgi:hypothetical protein